jgi:FAD/FMN-containing dehydrogenase
LTETDKIPVGYRKKLSGWGNYPQIEADFYLPENTDQLRALILSSDRIIARGNGKSYGDAALGGQVACMLSMNSITSFDPSNGIITCEAGVLLSDILPVIVPAGWFFHVTPGIKSISVGGAIASDVHGKNHPERGCFSNWLSSFSLMNASGDILTCSRDENTELFWQTCGGMGWTGVILSATFRLMRITSVSMRLITGRASHLMELFEQFEAQRNLPYGAAWIDTTASGSASGKGTALFAEHLPGDTAMKWEPRNPSDMPFYAPSWLLNPISIRLHNQLYFQRNKPGERTVHIDKYFYPLDGITNWNRLYGRRGFIQYQFCLPEAGAFEGIQEVLHTISASGEVPFLSVLKRHGARPPEAVNSFPVEGYSLALDFPRTRRLISLLNRLDETVWNNGGKIYLTKDAVSRPGMGRINMAQFAEQKFTSALRERLER